MLTKSMIAVILSLAVAAVLPVSPAQAKTDVDINIGIGFGGGYYGPGFGGWHDIDPGISCVKAKRIVFNRGFSNVRSIDCSAPNYKFTGWRGFQKFMIRVNDRGDITRIRAL